MRTVVLLAFLLAGVAAAQTVEIPFQVITPDGVLVPAGTYRLVRHTLLQHVGQPAASIGWWNGPAIALAGNGARFQFSTAMEYFVVYNPREFWAEKQFVRGFTAGIAPVIRNRDLLVGFVYNGDTLRITSAKRTQLRTSTLPPPPPK